MGPPKRKRAKRVSPQLQQPVSHTRGVAPEGWHPRLSSGLYMCAQTGTHLSEHMCTAPLPTQAAALFCARASFGYTGWFLRDCPQRSIYSQRLPVPQPIVPLISPFPKRNKTNWGCGVAGTESNGLHQSPALESMTASFHMVFPAFLSAVRGPLPVTRVSCADGEVVSSGVGKTLPFDIKHPARSWQDHWTWGYNECSPETRPREDQAARCQLSQILQSLEGRPSFWVCWFAWGGVCT